MESLHVAALHSVVDELVGRVALTGDGPLDEQAAGALDTFLDVAARHARAYVALLRSGSVVSTGETDALVDGVRDHIVALLCEHGGVADPTPLQLMTLRGWVALVEGSRLFRLEAGGGSGAGVPGAVPGREALRGWLVDQLFAMLEVTERQR